MQSKKYDEEFINKFKSETPLSELRTFEVRTPWAVPNDEEEATKRVKDEKIAENDHRSRFQHDIARIIHCKALPRWRLKLVIS